MSLDSGKPLLPKAQHSFRWKTWANAITALRFLLIGPLWIAIRDGYFLWALVFFSAAVLTDYLDGRVARYCNEVSRFGGLFDHASDAAFVSVGLWACASQGWIPVVLPPLVALAFIQYAVDSRVLAGHPLRTSFLGRWNGIAYFVLLGTVVVRNGLDLTWPSNFALLSGGWVLVVSTLASIADRGWAFFLSQKVPD